MAAGNKLMAVEPFEHLRRDAAAVVGHLEQQVALRVLLRPELDEALVAVGHAVNDGVFHQRL